MAHREDFSHAPVMLEEVLAYLAGEVAGAPVLYDLTLGLGGHARAFLDRVPLARLVGLDADPTAVERTRERLAGYPEGRVALHHASPRRVEELALARSWPRPTAVLLDLGLSSPQIEEAARGFSYRREGPLDMRFDPTSGPTAAELLLSTPRAALARALRELAEEPLADEVAQAIKRRLPVETTTQLAAIVLQAYGERPSRVHPARRTFQALRMLVNDELATIEEALHGAERLLVPGGRLVALSFHSGEDRVVKRALRGAARAGRLELLTRRPVRPREVEAAANQRARSAKLRAARKLPPGPPGATT